MLKTQQFPYCWTLLFWWAQAELEINWEKSFDEDRKNWEWSLEKLEISFWDWEGGDVAQESKWNKIKLPIMSENVSFEQCNFSYDTFLQDPKVNQNTVFLSKSLLQSGLLALKPSPFQQLIFLFKIVAYTVLAISSGQKKYVCCLD